MDNNNDNQFMSIFNDAHVDPNNTNTVPNQTPNMYGQNINDNPNIMPNFQDIPNSEQPKDIVSLSQDQINEQILGQSDILTNVGEMNHTETEEALPVEEKQEEPINILVVLIVCITLGIGIFAGINFAEKQLFNPKNSKRVKELVDKSYNFEESFSAYIRKINETSPITKTIGCVSEGGSVWYNHPDYTFNEDCETLLSTYKMSDSAVEVPEYGVIYINENGIKNGTHFIYEDYVCSYTSSEKKLFTCEKTEETTK